MAGRVEDLNHGSPLFSGRHVSWHLFFEAARGLALELPHDLTFSNHNCNTY